MRALLSRAFLVLPGLTSLVGLQASYDPIFIVFNCDLRFVHLI